MKHNKNHDNAPDAGPQLMPVHFEFTDPKAISVCVAGCFNHWKPEAKTLHPAGGGRWVKEANLLPGTYEYRFIVDGEWMADPLAKDYVPNPFGGQNSVLKVPSPAAVHRDEAEHLPLKKTNQQKTK